MAHTTTTTHNNGASAPAAWSTPSTFAQIKFEDSIKETADSVDVEVTHAAHCLIYARIPDSSPLVGLDKDKARKIYRRAAVLMHSRFDGLTGFPGGKIDDELTNLSPTSAAQLVTSALNRELVEELNYDAENNPLKWGDYLFTHKFTREITNKPIYTHFFSKELSLVQLEDLEKRSLVSREHGREVAGNVRVPLYTLSDGYRGLPAYLDGNFIGNARRQLELSLVELGLMTQIEIMEAVGRRRRV